MRCLLSLPLPTDPPIHPPTSPCMNALTRQPARPCRCSGCTDRVEEELGKRDAVTAVKADLDSGIVTVTVRADDLATAAGMLEAIVQEVNGMGFEAKPNL